MKNTLILILLAFFSACGGRQPSELQNMHDEVMVIHDEVMPKMRDINQAKKALRKIENPGSDSLIGRVIMELDEADEAMMAWMAQFKKPKGDDIEAARAYYIDQKTAIEDVKEQMLGSLATADKIISNNEQ